VIKIIKKIKNKQLRSFISFFITALLGAATNFITQIPYKILFLNMGMSDRAALHSSVAAAYLTATVISFVPAKNYAFSAKESGSTRRESIKFLLISTVGFFVQIIVTTLVLDYFANPFLQSFSLVIREKFSHAAAMGCSFTANFFGHQFLTFRSTGLYDRIKSPKN
jgi:putative flippase GtrA